MNSRTQWDDSFLTNLQKGFEALARNDFACIIMEADSSLMWILVRNATSEPYHLVWKITYATWKDLLTVCPSYSEEKHSVTVNACECSYAPVGNVSLKVHDEAWLFKGTFRYFVKALHKADKNILKTPSIIP